MTYNRTSKPQNSMLMLKRTLLIIIFGLTIFSCKTKVEPESTPVEKVNPGKPTPAPVVPDTLSSTQLEKIKKIQRVFNEVDPGTLEETIDDFKSNQHPDDEIATWLAMANAYEKFITKHKTFNANKKTEAYRLLLMRSIENEANAKAEIGLKYLSDKEVTEIFGYYAGEERMVTEERK